MATDAGLLECTFTVPANEEAHFNQILANTDRDNKNCYLSDNPYSFLSHCDSEKALALLGAKRLQELAAKNGISN